MANVIKGLTVEIGGDTTKLGKALEDVNKKSSNLSSELGDINRLLKFDPKNTDLLSQKQKVLAEAVQNTHKKLTKLQNAEKQVQEQFERGEVSEEQVRALRREIIATEKKMQGYQKAARETRDAVQNLGEESKEAAEKSDDLGDSLSNGVKVGLAAVAAGCAAAVAAIASSVEATQQYRTEMGKLTTAFTTNGHSAAAAQKTYEELQGLLGETEQAVEAANHLAKLTKSEEDLSKWTDICAGVYATFGASLPIEGLTEAANETAKVGAVTGPLADALNWAGVSEDKFNESLEKCNSEQERQKLIMDTLVGLYDDAADAYKDTNAEVIRSNKATEKLNQVWADVGSKAAPIVNTFKEGVAELGEALTDMVSETDVREFQLTMKTGFKDLSDNVMPKFINSLKWCVENFDAIESVAIGAAIAVGAYKVAVIAAEISQKGLTATLKATTVAQTALNLAQAATPWGLAAIAVAGLTAGLVAYAVKAEAAKKKTETLTLEERELQQAAIDAADAFREQQDTVAGNLGGIQSQMGHVSGLASELQRLANNSGEVEEKDRSRVQFILNELNSALGTEYKMVDGVVQKYGDLKKNIDAVIQSKTANALLEAGNEAYVTALQNENDALQRVVVSEKDYQSQLSVTQEAERVATEARAALQEKAANAKNATEARMLRGEAQRVAALERNAQRERELLTEKETEYNDAAGDYANYSNTIISYEDAQAAALEGNYSRAVEIMQGKGTSYGEYSSTVSKETQNVLNTLYKEAVDAGVAAANTKKNFENGVDGYTQEMVDEAEKGYEDALSAYDTAYNDAHGVGSDIGSGLSSGMESKRGSVIGKIRSIVSAIISAGRDEADCHSPAKETVELGEDMGDGAVVGLDNKSKDAEKAGRKLAENITHGITDKKELAKKTAEDLASLMLQSAQKRLDNHKVYNEMTLEEEIAYWDGVREQITDGTQAKIDADKKYFDKKKELNTKLADEEKKLNTKLADAEKKFQQAVDKTKQKVQQRTDSILSSMNIFELVKVDDAKSADDLLTGARSQVAALEMWQDGLAKLKEKTGDSAFYRAIEAQGVDAVNQLAVINAMTKDQFDEYVKLFDTREQLAKEQAENELSGEVAADLSAAYKSYIDTCTELGVATDNANQLMVGSAQTALTSLQGVLAGVQDVVAGVGGMGLRQLDGFTQAAAGGAAPGTASGQSQVFKMLQGIYERLGNIKMVLDSGILVGELIDDIDAALATTQALRLRGV